MTLFDFQLVLGRHNLRPPPSLCEQSEGHEHVAKIWGMTFLDFQLVLGRHNIRPPHFASKVSYSASPQAFAKSSRRVFF